MAFEINGSQPPAGARPVSNNYLPTMPESRFNNGQGVPVAVIGRPELRITFGRLKKTGWDWWAALTGDAVSVALTSIQFYNPYKSGGAGWDTWTGGAVLHRPKFEELRNGVFEKVEILITEMVAT